MVQRFGIPSLHVSGAGMAPWTYNGFESRPNLRASVQLAAGWLNVAGYPSTGAVCNLGFDNHQVVIDAQC